MKRVIVIAFLFASLPVFFSCKGEGAKEEVHPATAEEDHDEDNTTTLTSEQVKSIGLELGAIEQKQLTASLKANGVLRVPNQNRATVNSLYSGVIKSLWVQPGNVVRKGQVIATVTNPEFVQVQSDYLNVKAKIGLAEMEVKRQKELNEGNAGALKNLQAAETQLRTLLTAQSTYAQQISLMGINPAQLVDGKLVTVLAVKSPINGVVSDVNVEMGAYVDVTSPIAVIVDNSQLHLDLFVYEKELSRLRDNQLIHFTLTNNPGKEYDAKIYSLGSSFEGESKAVSVHARVEGNKTGLIDGMNITAVISLEQSTVAAVPSEAVVTLQGQDYIFILEEENVTVREEKEKDDHKGHSHPEKVKIEEGIVRFVKIPVAKGTSDVGYTEITVLEDIPPTAKIVVKGAFFVLAKMTNSGGHAH